MTSASMQLSPERNRYLQKRKQQKGQAQILLIGACILAAVLFLCLLISVIANFNSLAKANTKSGTTTDNNKTTVDSYQSYSIPSSDKAIGSLILVNSSHAYTFPSNTDNLVKIFDNRTPHTAEDGTIFTCYKVSNSSLLLDSKALSALNNMMDAFYAATGERNAIVNSAYRTSAEQEAMNSEIKAGYSDSHTGYLVSLKVYDGEKTYSLSDPAVASTYQWITDNCYKYGYIVRYPEGKETITGVSDYTYAFRYVGVAHATYMHDHNLCLEEYIELLHSYTFSGEHLTITTESGNYEVFYIPASSEATTTIYKTDDAIVSGDNESGFIITIPKS